MRKIDFDVIVIEINMPEPFTYVSAPAGPFGARVLKEGILKAVTTITWQQFWELEALSKSVLNDDGDFINFRISTDSFLDYFEDSIGLSLLRAD